jgi:hypothetical protein
MRDSESMIETQKSSNKRSALHAKRRDTTLDEAVSRSKMTKLW